MVVEPGSSARILSKEHLKLPNDIYGSLSGTSHFAREGITVNIATHIDPGFEGQIEFSITNNSGTPFNLMKFQKVATLQLFQLPYSTTSYIGEYQSFKPDIRRSAFSEKRTPQDIETEDLDYARIKGLDSHFKSQCNQLKLLRYFIVLFSSLGLLLFATFNPLRDLGIYEKSIWVLSVAGFYCLALKIHTGLMRSIQELFIQFNPDNYKHKHEQSIVSKLVELDASRKNT